MAGAIHIGQKFGRWTVLSREENAANYRAVYRCQCECGREKSVYGGNLRRGRSLSCGCLAIERGRRTSLKHGHSVGGCGTATYKAWSSMRSRCANHNRPRYADWGGRGIKVCERWLKFENFLADMGEKPAGLTLDRIENDGHYEPGNCRWATREEQARNRRNCRLTEDAARAIYTDKRRQVDIARDYGVSAWLVCAVKKGRIWKGAAGAVE